MFHFFLLLFPSHSLLLARVCFCCCDDFVGGCVFCKGKENVEFVVQEGQEVRVV